MAKPKLKRKKQVSQKRSLAAKKVWRTRRAKTKKFKRRGWKRDKSGHRIAALVGRAYRKRKSPPRYLRKKGVTPRGYARYRKAHPAPKGSRLKRRKHKPHTAIFGGRRHVFNPWYDDASGHRRASKKGWSRRRRKSAKRSTAIRKVWRMRKAKKQRRTSRRRRRYAANPVLPMEYLPNRSRSMAKARKRRRRRSHRNPLYRTRRGRYSGRKTRRRLKRIGGGGWRNNPRHRRRGRRRQYARRRYRQNAILPIPFSPNPYEGNQNLVGAITAPFEKIFDPKFLTGVALPTVGGFAATHIVAYQGTKLLGIEYTGFGKHLSRLVASGLVSGAGGLIFRDADVAANLLVGGLVATISGVVEDILGSTLTEMGMPSEDGGMMGLGQNDEEEMKDLIAEAVQSQIEEGGLEDYATAQAIGAAPHLSDYLTEQQLAASPTLAGGVAHFSQFVDQEADNALV